MTKTAFIELESYATQRDSMLTLVYDAANQPCPFIVYEDASANNKRHAYRCGTLSKALAWIDTHR